MPTGGPDATSLTMAVLPRVRALTAGPMMRYSTVPRLRYSRVPIKGFSMLFKRPAAKRGREPRADAQEVLRGRIMGAAFRLLSERGYAGTNTLEIARRAKVSKRELYALFGSKRGIVLQMVAMG